MQVLSWWSLIVVNELSPQLSIYGSSIITGKIPDFITDQMLMIVTNLSKELQLQRISLQSIDMESQKITIIGKSTSEISDDIQNILQSIVTQKNSVKKIEAILKILENRCENEKEKTINLQEHHVSTSIAQGYLENLQQSIYQTEQEENSLYLDLAYKQYLYANLERSRTIDERVASLQKAQQLLEGISKTFKDSTTYIAKYPSESIPVFTQVIQQLQQDITKTKEILTLYADEPQEIQATKEIQGQYQETQRLLQRSIDLLDQAQTGIAQAMDRVNLANSLTIEAKQRYQEARIAVSKGDFDVARNKLQLAGERYDASLAIQDNSDLRSERDQLLITLSAEISRMENEAVVRDVRRLLTSAKTAYFAGTFDKAEELLLQAQSRWKTTNVEDEPEITYWLTLVRGAISIRTGRTIPPSAPLYPEMSQLLSAAHKAFDEGQALWQAQQKGQAIEKFDYARQKIQEVRILYPLNQDASLLELKIEQIIDPETFAISFKQRLAGAQEKLTGNPQEAYSELQDLAEINPKYPGLKQIIEKAEIQLGLRLPPPDPEAITRANELINAARQIVNSNLRSQFPVALEQLNEALRLVPTNEEAITLKDKIQIDVGGKALIVLSSTAEQEYQQAVQELQNGNTIVAMSIVERLLQDPQNRNVPKVLELQRRIQARL
jgi:hypothetical protein